MRPMNYKSNAARRGYVYSGGPLRLPKTDVERLLLVVKQRRLKRDFLKRQETP